MIYALDSNVVIEILNKNKGVCKHRDDALNRGGDLVIPIITDYEVRRGFYHRPSPTKEKSYNAFCRLFPIRRMNDKIWRRGAKIYADLRRKGRTVDDADILIAAMCIENNYTLITHNNKHFDGIDELLKADWQGLLV